MVFYNSKIQFGIKTPPTAGFDCAVRGEFKEKFLLIHRGRSKKCGFHAIQKPFRHIFSIVANRLQRLVLMRHALCFTMTECNQT